MILKALILFQMIFQENGRAEADFGRYNVKTVLSRIYTIFSRSEIPIAKKHRSRDYGHGWWINPSTAMADRWRSLHLCILGLNLPCKFLTGMKFSWFTVKDEILFNFRRKHEELGLSNPKVEVQVLLMMGGKDYLMKFPGIGDYIKTEKMREFMADLEVVDLADGIHFMQEQFPKQVNHLLITFLTKHND